VDVVLAGFTTTFFLWEDLFLFFFPAAVASAPVFFATCVPAVADTADALCLPGSTPASTAATVASAATPRRRARLMDERDLFMPPSKRRTLTAPCEPAEGFL
jgi:hypothetical protein